MFESKYSKVLTVVLIVVIVGIVGLLGFLAYDFIKNSNNTKQASEFVEDYGTNTSTGEVTTSSEENVTLDNVEESINTSSSSTSGSSKKQYKGYTVAGTMKIPSINLEYPILEEVTTKSLETALVVLYPNGDALNQPGNTVIIGHNYNTGVLFSNLKKVKIGAKVYVTDFRGTTITYEVYNMFEADATDTSFYSRDTNGLAEITLSTCTNSGNNEKRTIVFAKQI